MESLSQMRRKAAIAIFAALLLCVSSFLPRTAILAEGEKDTYTQAVVTYTSPSWVNANNIGTAAVTPGNIQLTGFSGIDITNWIIGSSTEDFSMAYGFQTSFTTAYTGYKNIEFFATMPVGIILRTNVGDENIAMSYAFDYDTGVGKYRPIKGQGYLIISGGSGRLVDISQASNNRSAETEMSIALQSSTTPYKQVSASFSEIGASSVSFPLLGYDWKLNMTQKHSFLVAQVPDRQEAKETYSVNAEMPACFLDEVKRSVERQGIAHDTIQITLQPSLVAVASARYSVDYTVNVLNPKDATVKSGQTAVFRSGIDIKSIGTVADEEAFYGHTSYFEVSGDGGQHWEKVENSDNKDAIEVSATPQKDGYLYRNTVVIDDDNQTKVVSSPGRLGVISYRLTFDKNAEATVENMPSGRKGITPGAHIDKPQQTPLREGYDFTGWYTDSGQTIRWDFAGALESDLTLYAGWREKASAAATPSAPTSQKSAPARDHDITTTLKEKGNDADEAPSTGDNGPSPWLWLGVMLLMGGLAVGTVIALRRRKT